MATPKLDRIITEFARRIAKPVIFTNSVLQDNPDMTAEEYVAYVNKAMFEMFRSYWEAVKGDEEKFTELFPELVVTRSITFVQTNKYALASPNLDFGYLIDGRLNATNAYCRKLPKTQLNLALSGNLPYMPTITNPAVLECERNIYAFPKDSFIAEGGVIVLTFIALPLNPTTGGFLTQNGSYDSPFYDVHNSKIASIAEELWKSDSQRES